MSKDNHARDVSEMRVEQHLPRISVVTISYNQGKFLEETIKSVLGQNYPNLEHIVIDGGSRDESTSIIERYSDQLTYWCSEPDAGPASGLNKGFRHATGDILAFLNADDMFIPGTLHRFAELFRIHPTADVIFGDGYLTDSSGVLRKPTYSDPWSLWRVAYGISVIVQPATFFKREAFLRTKGFHEDHKAYWDARLWVDMALAGAKFRHQKEFLAVFRLHNLSITGSGREDKECERVMEELFVRIVGRPRRFTDKLLSMALRLWKFSGHPIWSLDYKLFLRSIQKGTRIV